LVGGCERTSAITLDLATGRDPAPSDAAVGEGADVAAASGAAASSAGRGGANDVESHAGTRPIAIKAVRKQAHLGRGRDGARAAICREDSGSIKFREMIRIGNRLRMMLA
jgi:hypothetical protein